MSQLWAWKLGATAISAMVNFVNLAWMLQRFSFKSVGCERVIRNQIPICSAASIEDTSGQEVARLRGEVRQLKDAVKGQAEELKDLKEELNRWRSTTDASSSSAASTYKLRFVEPLANRVYLGHPITSIGNKAVGVELVDPKKGNQRVTDGELSSLSVMMVPLKRGFNKSVKWDSSYFSSSILSLAENHIPLLQGGVSAVLCRGYAEIPTAKFSVSPGLNDKYVRIGVQVDPSCKVGPTILEAVSEELRLLCYRSKANQKPNTPKPNDPTWQIRGIGKNGPFHKALHDQKINTVKDFLRMLITQPAFLRMIADNCGERKKIRDCDWNKITLHAKECPPNPDEFYIYRCDSLGSSLLLNSFYQFVEAMVKGQHILSQDQLDPCQKKWIDQIKFRAYRNLKNLVPIRKREWKSIVSRSPTFEASPQISRPTQVNQDPPGPVQGPVDAHPVQGVLQVDQDPSSESQTSLNSCLQGQTDRLMSTMDQSNLMGLDQFNAGFVNQPELRASPVGANEPSEQIFSMPGWCPQSPGTIADAEAWNEYINGFCPPN